MKVVLAPTLPPAILLASYPKGDIPSLRYNPITALKLMSPPPIPPLECIAIINIIMPATSKPISPLINLPTDCKPARGKPKTIPGVSCIDKKNPNAKK